MANAPEGIVISSYTLPNPGVDYADIFGGGDNAVGQDFDNRFYPDQVLSLSKTQLEALDLVSEGPIHGLVSGEYIKTGVAGEIGWRTAIFTGYETPVGYENSRFLRSVYWNEVPVMSETAQFNFQSVSVAQTPGYPNGEAIQVLSPFQTVSRSIGERLRAGSQYVKTYRISNRDCRGVVVNIKVPQLYTVIRNPGTKQDGSVVRTRIDYSISYRAYYKDKTSSNYVIGKSPTIFGKITSAGGYIRSERIDFPVNFLNDPSFIGWEIQIQRSTPDSRDPDTIDVTYVDSLTEIQGNVYTFPNSAMVRSLFDAEYFSSVPERAYDVNLLKVKIPGNYDPILKTYATGGFATSNYGWNGEFATGKHHTDNPAWCYYDLLTNRRYGLGRYIDPSFVDPISLYEIGKYCDTLVSDGYGKLEPKFTCNVWLTSREEAYKVVNDMASIFLGMTYYANGSIYVSQDSPKDPIITFTNANVEDGNFNYSTSSKKSRNSIAIVRYNDPKNFYRPSIEYVEDVEQIRRYGIREIELTAFGCASRGQAQRMGRWILLSDKLEPESVNFSAGIGEAAYLRPGDIFKIHDTHKKLKRYGGRTVSVAPKGNNTTSEVVLDNRIDIEPTVEYKISFLTPSYSYNSSQVTGINSTDASGIRRQFLQEFYFTGSQAVASGSRMVVNLSGGFDYDNYRVTGQQVWMMELSDRYASYSGNIYFSSATEDYYRVINIEEKETNKFYIAGLQYNFEKYGEIESGLVFHSQQKNQINIPASPRNLSLNVFDTSETTKRIDYAFIVDSMDYIDSFQVYMKQGSFLNNGLPSNSYLIPDPWPNTHGGQTISETGSYNFRVYSYNSQQSILSPNFTSGIADIYSIDPIFNVIISNLRLSQ
jgi:predicted phage tail protein